MACYKVRLVYGLLEAAQVELALQRLNNRHQMDHSVSEQPDYELMKCGCQFRLLLGHALERSKRSSLEEVVEEILGGAAYRPSAF